MFRTAQLLKSFSFFYWDLDKNSSPNNIVQNYNTLPHFQTIPNFQNDFQHSPQTFNISDDKFLLSDQVLIPLEFLALSLIFLGLILYIIRTNTSNDPPVDPADQFCHVEHQVPPQSSSAQSETHSLNHTQTPSNHQNSQLYPPNYSNSSNSSNPYLNSKWWRAYRRTGVDSFTFLSFRIGRTLVHIGTVLLLAAGIMRCSFELFFTPYTSFEAFQFEFICSYILMAYEFFLSLLLSIVLWHNNPARVPAMAPPVVSVFDPVDFLNQSMHYYPPQTNLSMATSGRQSGSSSPGDRSGGTSPMMNNNHGNIDNTRISASKSHHHVSRRIQYQDQEYGSSNGSNGSSDDNDSQYGSYLPPQSIPQSQQSQNKLLQPNPPIHALQHQQQHHQQQHHLQHHHQHQITRLSPAPSGTNSLSESNASYQYTDSLHSSQNETFGSQMGRPPNSTPIALPNGTGGTTVGSYQMQSGGGRTPTTIAHRVYNMSTVNKQQEHYHAVQDEHTQLP
jgi:hypothetical protein